MTAGEAALVGKWGVIRGSYPGNASIGQIERFTELRVYVTRPYRPSPRWKFDLLGIFVTEADAGRAAQAYSAAFRGAQAEADRASEALSAARRDQLAKAEAAAGVGSTPLPWA